MLQWLLEIHVWDNLSAGVLQADPGVIREHDQVFRLFCHECQRVFHDRLVDKTDKRYFYGILSEMSSKHFSKVGDSCMVMCLQMYPLPVSNTVHIVMVLMTGYQC